MPARSEPAFPATVHRRYRDKGQRGIYCVASIYSLLGCIFKARVHFGLGTEAAAGTIEILWPSGIRQTLKEIRADQILQIQEPQADTPNKNQPK